jgi:hypothetical protein
MVNHVSRLVRAVAAVAVVSAAAPVAAQPDNVNFRFNSGQPIQPIYEGWERNPTDRTITMYFGYINRNYVEELAIPVGAENSFSPGPADRGQPTWFYTRIHRQIFSVKLPATWNRAQPLTWTVTANGVTLKAVGWMQAEWEIDAETGGQMQNEDARANKPPTLAIGGPTAGPPGARLVLTASVTDDGLPKPAKRSAIGGVSPPTLRPNPDDPEIPVNVPQVSNAGRGGRVGPGLSVSWILWRGPAAVTFSPQATAAVKEGQAAVTGVFTQAGTYVIRVSASDGARSSDVKEMTVTIAP